MSISLAVPHRAGRRNLAERELYTFNAGLLHALTLSKVAEQARIRWPNPLYAQDPVRFAREILGFEPWSRQREILEAVRDHDRVSVVSGHKCGKSTTAATLALWWFASFEDARCVMSSTTARQVDQILWRELRMLRARAGRCVDCKLKDPYGLTIPTPCEHSATLDGDQAELARSGLKTRVDFREITGFTARDAESIAGISGRKLLFIIDEASGVPDPIFEAIEGNRAGSAKLVLLGNGTRNEGEFFESFHSKARHYHNVRMSSEETPNVVEGRSVVPGLATREWIEEKKDEWGETSPIYIVRAKGGFATSEAGKIFSLHAIAQSQVRWHETPDSGRLFIGVDPAGESGTGDEAAFVARRGYKMLEARRRFSLNEAGHLAEVLDMISAHALARETVVVVVDREGPIGSRVNIELRNYAAANPGVMEVSSVRASDRATRKPHHYDRARDELAANLEMWMREGGAIIEDAKLEGELHCLRWEQAINGRYKVIPKRVIRKVIGRSPDTYDALSLATWESLSLSAGDEVPTAATSTDGTGGVPHAAEQFDPYAAMDIWRR